MGNTLLYNVIYYIIIVQGDKKSRTYTMVRIRWVRVGHREYLIFLFYGDIM
jgi:hypothetical protein